VAFVIPLHSHSILSFDAACSVRHGDHRGLAVAIDLR
jgi:hypothetical protein